jgi:hypothetical protein
VKNTRIYRKGGIPSVLEPNFDLFGLDVGENGALPYKLLAAHGAGFWAVVVEPFERLNLLGRVPHILTVIHSILITILAG